MVSAHPLTNWTTDNRRIHAFWCRIPSRPNFGDALTPWLIQRISGRYPIFVRPDDPRDKYLVSGSILEYARAGCIVWGSGIIAQQDHVSPDAEIRAVRGPLSRTRALQCGAQCPEIFGDPALLLPRFYKPAISARHGVGLIAHYSDGPRLEALWSTCTGLRLINIQDPIESVVDQIVACEATASSSLHGLIVSHAYGIPALWVKFRDPLHGDDTKFHDYYHSVDQHSISAHWLDEKHVDVTDIARCLPPLPTLPDLHSFWQACPFRSDL